MSEMYLILVDDIKALGLPKETEEQTLVGLRNVGRRIDQKPAASILKEAEAEVQSTRRDIETQMLKPTPQILELIEKNPKLQAAQAKLENLRKSMGM